jgi:hypothetical protein
VLGEVGPARLVVQLGGWALQRHQQHLQGRAGGRGRGWGVGGRQALR